jgi:exonuclease I
MSAGYKRKGIQMAKNAERNLPVEYQYIFDLRNKGECRYIIRRLEVYLRGFMELPLIGTLK